MSDRGGRRFSLENNSENAENQLPINFVQENGFNALMAGDGRGCRIALPFDFGGHLHTFVTFICPYALRTQPYALFARKQESARQ